MALGSKNSKTPVAGTVERGGNVHALLDTGNSLAVIEHNLEVMQSADHIIDIGPEDSAGCGQIVALAHLSK